MTNKRVCEILKNKDIKEIYYNDQPVWIQEVHGNKATVGFVGSNDTKDLYIKELYEANQYNSWAKKKLYNLVTEKKMYMIKTNLNL